MEQARFWMWASSKSSSGSNFVLPVSSWEEEAFKEDAAGPFGAFIWPPRSYNCSFCGREFKSAQALGGHMNVHRRDRARLKQSSPPSERKNLHHKKYDIQKHNESTVLQYPNHTSTMDNNTNSVDTNSGETLASLSPITASNRPFFSSHSSFSHPAAIRSPSVVDSNIEEEFYTKKQNSGPHESDIVKPDFSVSLNLAVASGNNEMVSCKRRRTDGLSLPFFLNATTEELDLELRLGG